VLDGTLEGGATTTSDRFAVGIEPERSSQYVNLPATVGRRGRLRRGLNGTAAATGDASSISGDTSRYVMLTTRANSGWSGRRSADDAAGGIRNFDAPTALPLNTWTIWR